MKGGDQMMDGVDAAGVAFGGVSGAGYRAAGVEETVRANRSWWDGATDDYLATHGDYLADRFVWCPEGLDEAQARLLGDVAGADVLEVGCGAAQCARWLVGQGARVVALDLSIGMLRSARRPARQPAQHPARQPVRHASRAAAAAGPGDRPPPGLVLVQADARRLPLADGSVDLACSAYGAVPFVADPEQIMREVARVLRPGGLWAFAATHPTRWAFPDDPGEAGLTATRSYFDRTPYVEEDARGRVLYAEHHRTLGDRVRGVVAAGLELVDLVEPEWPPEHQRVWGGWSPSRGRLIPGTAIFVTRKPG